MIVTVRGPVARLSFGTLMLNVAEGWFDGIVTRDGNDSSPPGVELSSTARSRPFTSERVTVPMVAGLLLPSVTAGSATLKERVTVSLSVTVTVAETVL